jgi:hypothetical protein
MESTSSSIFPIPPTGEGRRITVVNYDLLPNAPINNVFVYPSLDVKRLKKALEQTLSLWPVVCGHIETDNAYASNYSLVCSDNAVPFTFVENAELDQWPTDLSVVVSEPSQLAPYLDPVSDELRKSVPLLRFKITHLTRSEEYIFGVSFSHVIGDAASVVHFLNDLSRLYQHLEPLSPRPVFERYLVPEEKADLSLLPRIKICQNAAPEEELLKIYHMQHQSSDPLTMTFSSQQLALLRTRVGGNQLIMSTNDALIAYIIFRLNTHFFLKEEVIQRASILVDYRGISTVLCSSGQVGNCVMHVLSDDFSDPYSFSNIAQTLRRSINKARKESFALSQVATQHVATKQLNDKQLERNWSSFDNEVSVNSQYKFDWAEQVDMGMTNQCRMHMSHTGKLYFRVFRTNPVREKDGTWTRDVGAAELSFRLAKRPQKEIFIQTWKNDVMEHFASV